MLCFLIRITKGELNSMDNNNFGSFGENTLYSSEDIEQNKNENIGHVDTSSFGSRKLGSTGNNSVNNYANMYENKATSHAANNAESTENTSFGDNIKSANSNSAYNDTSYKNSYTFNNNTKSIDADKALKLKDKLSLWKISGGLQIFTSLFLCGGFITLVTGILTLVFISNAETNIINNDIESLNSNYKSAKISSIVGWIMAAVSMLTTLIAILLLFSCCD